MMAKARGSGLGNIFDDEPEAVVAPTVKIEPEAPKVVAKASPTLPRRKTARAEQAPAGQGAPKAASVERKEILLRIPRDMHRVLRQLSVEEGGEPITVVTERKLREYLVERGYTKFAP